MRGPAAQRREGSPARPAAPSLPHHPLPSGPAWPTLRRPARRQVCLAAAHPANALLRSASRERRGSESPPARPNPAAAVTPLATALLRRAGKGRARRGMERPPARPGGLARPLRAGGLSIVAGQWPCQPACPSAPRRGAPRAVAPAPSFGSPIVPETGRVIASLPHAGRLRPPCPLCCQGQGKRPQAGALDSRAGRSRGVCMGKGAPSNGGVRPRWQLSERRLPAGQWVPSPLVPGG